MAGDPLKKVQSGDQLRIPAEAYNAFIDAVRATRGQQALGAEADSLVRQTTLAKVRNLTGSDRERFAIIGLSQPIVMPSVNESEFLRQPTFDAVIPAGGYEGRFGVLLEPVPAGKIGMAAIAGFVPVRMLVNPTAIYDHAEMLSGTTYMVQNVPHGSARVVWIDPFGGPVRWAMVRLDDGDREAVVFITSNMPGADGLYPGIVQRYVAGVWVTQYACKVKDLNA